MITHVIYKSGKKTWSRAYLPDEAPDKHRLTVPYFSPASVSNGATIDMHTLELRPSRISRPDSIIIGHNSFRVERGAVRRGAFVIDDEAARILHDLDAKIEALNQQIDELRGEKQAEMEQASLRSRKLCVSDCKQPTSKESASAKT